MVQGHAAPEQFIPPPKRSRVGQTYVQSGNSLSDRANARIAAAMEEIDPAGFEAYLMSRASVHDPRVSTAVFASNSMRRAKHGPAKTVTERCLTSLASHYAGSRLDPFMHSTGGLRDPSISGPAYNGAGRLTVAGVTASNPTLRSQVCMQHRLVSLAYHYFSSSFLWVFCLFTSFLFFSSGGLARRCLRSSR